jgi:hypothetical protein
MRRFNQTKLRQLRRKICSMLDNIDKVLSEDHDRLCGAGLWCEMTCCAINLCSERPPSESIG